MKKAVKRLALFLVLALALTGCKGSDVPEKVLIQENVYTCSDGAEVSAWRFESDGKLIYQLSDGTELLATRVSGPERSMQEGEESFNQLEDRVQEQILGFYQQQEKPYQLEDLLEMAYGEQQENPEDFRCYLVTEETVVTASDETTVTCTTTVSLPIGHGENQTHTVVHTFDRTTGALVKET